MTDPAHGHKDFPLADVLSVTTGKLLSRRKMAGLCELVAWITKTPVTPGFMSPEAVAELLDNAALAKAMLIGQHPFLADVQPPAGLRDMDLYAWLAALEGERGGQIAVRRRNDLTPGQLAACDQFEAKIQRTIRDGGARIAASFARLSEQVQGASERLRELADALGPEADDTEPAPPLEV